MDQVPTYVRVQDYEEVLATLETVKKKVAESRALLQRLGELKAEEDREILAWSESLDDVSGRIDILEKTLR
jgi:hypothetical protein